MFSVDMAARRALLLVPVLLAVLALVAPLAAMADSCPDCGPQGCCCPSACCTCCRPGSPWVTAAATGFQSACTGRVGERPADRCPAALARDVFHVPKLPSA